MNASRRNFAINDEPQAPGVAPAPRIYDPYSLATRPLPTDLELFAHPNEIDVEAARRITGGVLC